MNEKEKKFLEFCKTEGIVAKPQGGSSPAADRVYTATIPAEKDEYLDGTEKRIVEYCKRHNIKFDYCSDGQNHHYNFYKLVDPREEDYFGRETPVPILPFPRSACHPPPCYHLPKLGVFSEKVEKKPKTSPPKKTLRQRIKSLWQRIRLAFRRKEKAWEKEERENLEFINSLGHKTQEELLKMAFLPLDFERIMKEITLEKLNRRKK